MDSMFDAINVPRRLVGETFAAWRERVGCQNVNEARARYLFALAASWPMGTPAE